MQFERNSCEMLTFYLRKLNPFSERSAEAALLSPTDTGGVRNQRGRMFDTTLRETEKTTETTDSKLMKQIQGDVFSKRKLAGEIKPQREIRRKRKTDTD